MDLEIIRGDTVNIQFEVESDTVLDLSSNDFTVFFSLKKSATDTAYIFQKNKAVVTSPADNVFILRIAPEDTTHLLPGYYFYDIQLGIGDDIYTIAIGKFTINVDITRPPVVLPEFPFPDINNDGLITETDAQMILTASINIVQGLPSGLTEDQEDLADCNRDGVIDSIDVSLVLAFCTDVANGLYNNTALGWTLFMTDNYTS